jgi:hypothetical protein
VSTIAHTEINSAGYAGENSEYLLMVIFISNSLLGEDDFA